MLDKKIAFVGSGVMAEALIAGLLRRGLASPQHLLAAGPRADRGDQLREKYGIQTFTDNTLAVAPADLIVLSVKPQRLGDVLEALKGFRTDALVLSVVAGASIRKFSTGRAHAEPAHPHRNRIIESFLSRPDAVEGADTSKEILRPTRVQPRRRAVRSPTSWIAS